MLDRNKLELHSCEIAGALREVQKPCDGSRLSDEGEREHWAGVLYRHGSSVWRSMPLAFSVHLVASKRTCAQTERRVERTR